MYLLINILTPILFVEFHRFKKAWLEKRSPYISPMTAIQGSRTRADIILAEDCWVNVTSQCRLKDEEETSAGDLRNDALRKDITVYRNMQN